MKILKITTLCLLSIFANTTATSQNNTLYFDGVNDQVVINNHPDFNFNTNTSFSIEGWIKTSLSGNHSIIFSKLINNSTFRGYDVTIQNTKLTFSLINDYGSGNAIKIQGNTTLTDGTWHHIACVYKGVPSASNVDMYVDGVLQSQSVVLNGLSATFSNTTAVTIGVRGDQTYFFNGSIDEIRVWKKALCSSEVVAKKNCHLIGNESNLVAYYNFNQGTAGGNNSAITTLTDLSSNAHTGTLTNIALSGSTSNFVAATNGVAGICQPFLGSLAVSGNTLMCSGTSQTLTANGANSYTWSTGPVSSSIAISPTVNTTYTLTGLNQANCLTSLAYTQSVSACTGVNELKNEITITLYPNPAKGQFIVEGLETGSIVEMFNSNGQLIWTSKVSFEKTKINIEGYNAGVYVVRILSGNESAIHRLIVE